MTGTLRLGTRASALARWQTDRIGTALAERVPGLRHQAVLVRTRGDDDRISPIADLGEVGVFTEALERALHDGEIDLAVHSLKDLPTESDPHLTVAAICFREDVRDVLVGPDSTTLDGLPVGARVGTSSLRRRAQLLARRPDLEAVPVRGNVDTRLRKARDGTFDAVILAAAGLARLGLTEAISEYLPLEIMLPAPGQGALAVQCRADDARILAYARLLDEPGVRAAVVAERTFLAALGGGCSAPVGAHGVANGAVQLTGLVSDPDGHRTIRVQAAAALDEPEAAGRRAAEEALARGAAELLP